MTGQIKHPSEPEAYGAKASDAGLLSTGSMDEANHRSSFESWQIEWALGRFRWVMPTAPKLCQKVFGPNHEESTFPKGRVADNRYPSQRTSGSMLRSSLSNSHKALAYWLNSSSVPEAGGQHCSTPVVIWGHTVRLSVRTRFLGTRLWCSQP